MIVLTGERLTQRKVGMGVTSEYVFRKHTFVCVGEVEGVRHLGDFEDIHLKSVAGSCIACGLSTNMIFPHYDEDQADRWVEHPRRCNHAYVP